MARFTAVVHITIDAVNFNDLENFMKLVEEEVEDGLATRDGTFLFDDSWEEDEEED